VPIHGFSSSVCAFPPGFSWFLGCPAVNFISKFWRKPRLVLFSKFLGLSRSAILSFQVVREVSFGYFIFLSDEGCPARQFILPSDEGSLVWQSYLSKWWGRSRSAILFFQVMREVSFGLFYPSDEGCPARQFYLSKWLRKPRLAILLYCPAGRFIFIFSFSCWR
jgi:hypothetical protein